MKFRTWLNPLYVFCFVIKVCCDLKAWATVLRCDALCVMLSCSVSSDLPCDSVALGALHASPLPASPHRLELLPAHNRKGQQQPGLGECRGLPTSVLYRCRCSRHHITCSLVTQRRFTNLVVSRFKSGNCFLSIYINQKNQRARAPLMGGDICLHPVILSPA